MTWKQKLRRRRRRRHRHELFFIGYATSSVACRVARCATTFHFLRVRPSSLSAFYIFFFISKFYCQFYFFFHLFVLCCAFFSPRFSFSCLMSLKFGNELNLSWQLRQLASRGWRSNRTWVVVESFDEAPAPFIPPGPGLSPVQADSGARQPATVLCSVVQCFIDQPHEYRVRERG